MAKYSFDKKAKFRGKWYVPGAEDVEAFGTLRYSPGRISLKTRGDFRRPTNGKRVRNFQQFDLIHGIADDGTKLSLFSVRQNGMKTNSHGLELAKFNVELIVVGCHVTSRDEFLVSAMRFGGSSLDWFVFGEIPESKHPDGVNGIEIRYQLPPTLSYRLDSISSKLEIDGSYSSSNRGRFGVDLFVSNIFRLMPDNPLDFDKALDYVMKCCHLITLFTNYGCAPSWIEARVAEDNTLVSLLFKRHTLPQEDGEDWLEFLMDLRLVGEKFGAALDKWLGESATFWNAVYQFIDSRLPKSGDSLEPRFQMATQLLEAFSRATTSSFYMSPSDYEKVIAALNSHIPENVASDHRASLKNRIRFGNEYSLRKRLTLLLDSLGDDCKSLVCNCADSFIGGTVDTRNCLVHSSEDLSEQALTHGDMYWAIEKLLMLARILMLRHVGLAEKEIADAIKGHPGLSQYKGLWQQHKERIAAKNAR